MRRPELVEGRIEASMPKELRARFQAIDLRSGKTIPGVIVEADEDTGFLRIEKPDGIVGTVECGPKGLKIAPDWHARYRPSRALAEKGFG